MSTNLAHSYLADDPAPARPEERHGADRRNHIRAVPTSASSRTRPRVVYALITVAGLFLIVISQLLLSVGVSEGAYEIAGLEEQQKTLSRTYEDLSVQLDSVASPQNLAANAEALGMVRNTNASVFLRLSDGKVLGVPQAAKATAGSVIGAGGLVPNALLKKVPLVTQQPQPGAKNQSAPTQSNVPGPLPLQSGMLQGAALQSGLASPTTR
jgi:hypothetical protein